MRVAAFRGSPRAARWRAGWQWHQCPGHCQSQSTTIESTLRQKVEALTQNVEAPLLPSHPKTRLVFKAALLQGVTGASSSEPNHGLPGMLICSVCMFCKYPSRFYPAVSTTRMLRTCLIGALRSCRMSKVYNRSGMLWAGPAVCVCVCVAASAERQSACALPGGTLASVPRVMPLRAASLFNSAQTRVRATKNVIMLRKS